jgi:hypothetical protein
LQDHGALTLACQAGELQRFARPLH